MKLRYKSLLAALALAAVAAGAAGVARSTSTQPIPDANGVIHGCYKKPIGPVRIVYSAANCFGGELPIEWNQAGAQGPQGPQGETGPQGPAGPPGAAGPGVQTFESDGVDNDIEIGSARTGIFVTLGEPGTYWVFAKALVTAGTHPTVGPDTDAIAGCDLELDFVKLDTTPTMFLEAVHDEDRWVTLADIAQATQAGQRLKLVCEKRAGELPLSLYGARLYALKVA